jgi:hypothetical protein
VTSKELEKVLRKSDVGHLLSLGESVAISPMLDLLANTLKWQRRYALWSIPFGGIAAQSLLFLADRIPGKLGFHPESVKFSPESFLTFLFVYSIGLGLVSRRHLFRQTLWVAANRLFLYLARRAEQTDIFSACKVLWELRGGLTPGSEEELDDIVAPLLLQLDDEEARNLPEDARRWIRWRLKRSGSPEFRIAALLALAGSGDTRLASVANQLRSATDERVQAAAIEALRIMQENRR